MKKYKLPIKKRIKKLMEYYEKDYNKKVSEDVFMTWVEEIIEREISNRTFES